MTYLNGRNCPKQLLDWLGLPPSTTEFTLHVKHDETATIVVTRLVEDAGEFKPETLGYKLVELDSDECRST